MIVLHHLERSRSHRILWLLEELGLEYELKIYQRDTKTLLAPKALKDLHPLGKSPVLQDGHHTVAESSVIIEYLLDQYGEGRLRPVAKSPEYYDYLYFLHAAEGSFMPYLFLSFVMSRLSKSPVPLPLRPVAKMLAWGLDKQLLQPNFKNQFQFLDRKLAANNWLAGDAFSAADIQMSYPLLAAQSRMDLSDYPQLGRFLQRIKDRPSFKKALQKGGPVEL